MADQITDMPYISPRQRVLLRWDEMQRDRSDRVQDWRDINDYLLPRRFRYLATDRKAARRRNTKIINGTGTRALGILTSGLMAGMTNPSRPWQRLLADLRVRDVTEVKDWTALATQTVLDTYSRSNLYKCLPKFYKDSAAFGTAVLYVERDQADVLRGYVIPLGQYCIANDSSGRVDTVYREFQLSVINIVEQFGWEKVSQRVKEMYRSRKFGEMVTILHAVEPRRKRVPGLLDAKNKPWSSIWMEKEGDDNTGFLRESGYDRFPFFVFRWEVSDDASDAYGDGLGLDAVGDAMAIQLLERRKAQGVDKIVQPPMVGPAGMKSTNVSLIPNGLTVVDVPQGGQQFRTAIEIPVQAVKVIEESIAIHELRLNKIFMADLWLMLASSDRREITAREVDERHEEKMIQLGPQVDRLGDELIDPLTEWIVNELIDRGDLPPPPPELAGVALKVDNISIIGQAQKLVGTVGLERLAGFVGNIAAVKKDVLDNMDFDRVVRNYADMLGVTPDNLKAIERMEAEREQAAQQEQAAQVGDAMQPLAQGAQAAKVLSETDVNGDSALSRLMESVGAGGAPLGGGLPQ